MLIQLLGKFFHDPIGLLFIIISIGLLLGRIPLGPLRLGGSSVLLAGLILGHFGGELPKVIQTIGVVLFVYSVGLKAGPGFAKSFKDAKMNFLILSLVIVGTAGSLAFLFKSIFKLPSDLIIGIYAGAMTSTPALGAAMETLKSSTPSIGYGLAYPIGVIGVIIMVQLLPFIFRVNLKDEETKYNRLTGLPTIEQKTFKVTNPNMANVSYLEITDQTNDRVQIARIKRGDRIFSLKPDDKFELGDLALAVGLPEDLNKMSVILGQEEASIIPQSEESQSRWLLVSSKKFIGKKFGNFELLPLFGVVASRIRRGSLEFIPQSNFVLEAGDQIRVSGNPKDITQFAAITGLDPNSIHETDHFSFSLGLALGVLIGLIRIPITENINIQLGLAGGPLIIGLLFGHVGRFGQITGRLPKAANDLIGDFGLYLFLAAAGVLAGKHFLEIIRIHGFILIFCAVALTLIPILVAAFVARVLFKMNLLLALGMICGGMTSTPALGVLTSNTKSDIPALGYTTIYPMAVLITTLMVQLLVLL